MNRSEDGDEVRRALVLGGGLAWCAYQIGALRHLVSERGLRFDLVAGTGIGALNAALVACGRFDALERFWSDLSLRKLLRLNLRSPFRDGPFVPGAQRRLVADHVGEHLLAQQGSRLLVSVFDLQIGLAEALVYPGSDVPIVEAVMAAGATPGLLAPIRHDDRQLAEGSVIDSVPVGPVLDLGAREIVVVGVGLAPAQNGVRRYRTWPQIASRALVMNQSHDLDAALALARGRAAAADARHTMARSLPDRVAARVSDASTAARVRAAVEDVFGAPAPPPGPVVRAVRPSRDLGYPMWRCRRRDLGAAIALGERDAREAFARGPGDPA